MRGKAEEILSRLQHASMALVLTFQLALLSSNSTPQPSLASALVGLLEKLGCKFPEAGAVPFLSPSTAAAHRASLVQSMDSVIFVGLD